jgi:hypothetical protein
MRILSELGVEFDRHTVRSLGVADRQLLDCEALSTNARL